VRIPGSSDVKRSLERRQAFATTHLARWIPSLAGAIKRAGQHPFYDALAVLLTSLHPETASP
jgi:TorA maturation chaperone TorD